MSNDETIFSNRTNRDIDEALAWLDGLTGNTTVNRRSDAAQTTSAPSRDQYNLPTWLRMDIRVEPPKSAETSVVAEDDSLSWIDRLNDAASSSLEEPPTMNWGDTDVYAATEEIRAAQDEVRQLSPPLLPTNALNEAAITDEPTNLTEDVDRAAALADDDQETPHIPAAPPELETQPVQDVDVAETPVLELDTEASSDDAPDRFASANSIDPQLEEILGNPDDLWSKIETAMPSDATEIVPPGSNDPFLDVSDQAIADWLNSADHGTAIIAPMGETPRYGFDDFPELGDLIGADLEDAQRPEIVAPDPTLNDPLAESVTAASLPDSPEPAALDEATDIILPEFAPQLDQSEPTEIVLPPTPAMPEMEETHILLPESDLSQVELPEAKLPEAKLPEAELPEVELPEAELPEAKLPEPELTEVELPEAKLPTADPFSALDEATDIVPPDEMAIDRQLMQTAQAEWTRQEGGPNAIEADAAEDEKTNIVPYDLKELTDALMIEAFGPDAVNQPESAEVDTPPQLPDEKTHILPYDLDAPTEVLIDPPTRSELLADEQTHILPYELPETSEPVRDVPLPEALTDEPLLDAPLPETPVDELKPNLTYLDELIRQPVSDTLDAPVDLTIEDTQIVPYDLDVLPAADLPDEPTIISALELPIPADIVETSLPDLPAIAASEAETAEDEEETAPLDPIVPSSLPELPEMAALIEESAEDEEETAPLDALTDNPPTYIQWLDEIADAASAFSSETPPAAVEAPVEEQVAEDAPTEDRASMLPAEDAPTEDRASMLPPDIVEILDSLSTPQSTQPSIDEEPERRKFDTWDVRIPRDPIELASLSAPTIITQMPISERWRHTQEDPAETEALDLLNSPVLDTMHADQAQVEDSLTPEQLADLTEPVDFSPETLPDLTEPVDSTPSQPVRDMSSVATLADEIPDDPDEAIAWLERMAKQESANLAAPKPPVEIESFGLDNVPHFLETADPAEEEPPEFAEKTIVTAVGASATDEMESFMRELEQAMDASDPSDSESPPLARASEPLPEELSDALAWLEDLVAGSENPLDETTVELNEADVQALLNQAIPQPTLPEPEVKLPAQPAASAPPPAVEKSPPPAEGGELDEALAWLEAFANEESSLILPDVASEQPAPHLLPNQPVRQFNAARTRAENALTLGDYTQVAREYTTLIEHEKSAALDVVIEDMTRITRQVTNSPLLYRVLGDAYAKQLNFELAAQAYRNGLDLL